MEIVQCLGAPKSQWRWRRPRDHRRMATQLFMAAGIIAGLGVCGAGAARGDIITLTDGLNGYAGARDNTIYDHDGGLANGAGDHVFTGQNGQGQNRRALIMFDLDGAGLPNDEIVVTSVGLTMTVSQTNSQSRVISLHRLLADWGEGAEDAGGSEGAGAIATPGTSTWTHNFYDTSTWASLGGDFDPLASASAEAPLFGTVTWSGERLIADVQAWIDGTIDNFGWIMIGDESQVSTAVRFVSSDNDEDWPLESRPTLVIEYEVIPAPPAMFAALGGVLMMAAPRRSRRRRVQHK